jgi:hypothetical protein
MLAAYRLASLSALEAHYAGVDAPSQFTAGDRRRFAAPWPCDAGTFHVGKSDRAAACSGKALLRCPPGLTPSGRPQHRTGS